MGCSGRFLAFLLFAIAAWAGSAHAQNDTTFEIVNRARVPIFEVYVSPSALDDWGRDVLRDDVILPGARKTVRPAANECIFDVRIVYRGGQSEERRRQNLCQLSEMAFDGGAPAPSAQADAQGDPSFALVNRAPRTIAQIYVSRASETDWGRDRLGDDVLAAGQRFNVDLPQGPCQWDIAVVYDDDRREELRNQNLCSLTEVAFDASNARASGTPAAPAPNRRPNSEQARGNEQSFGTGFFVSAQGHMLTNAHVAGDCQRIGVMLETGRVAAQLVRKDERNDLALIKVDVRGTVPFARFRAQPSIRAGDDIVVAGFPLPTLLQNGLNITTGNVSAMSGLGGNIALMQITAPVQPGNSGGPLLDMSGNLVGVVVSKLNAQRVAQSTGDIPQNVNFAVQGAVARLFLEAGGQRYAEAPSQRDMKAADVADLSRSFTFQIECR
ncbi:MAG: trypsin-like peptidase domain-containing protein [Telmatospirillum sp.]|nr:trypsin-like peptidase domain-containing protein [Telmatospirillum sp.]